ncbi:Mannosylfructose-phosphate phosphatase [Planctomycetes bacterium CA13]|uniref:Mannosylfructose-phosphate phosphatase n=1 Tax=Novipirellula herctigrandis TaxID=2527986 RepID=A0A5C5YVC2_9BACT|nr:Mannosylfructose-phosphate phosphatase [Planctomycetes bacterium CA13]
MNNNPGVLATDLDGTLIPLSGNQSNHRDLVQLSEHFQSCEDTLVFVTGRHFDSAHQAIRDHQLPRPDWIICDVGTTICRSKADGSWEPSEAYADVLTKIVCSSSFHEIRAQLVSIPQLRLQEAEKQGKFKLSFYCEGHDVDVLASRVKACVGKHPFSIVSSVDPFNGDGLIDLLPLNASKAFALRWWAQSQQHDETRVVFAGDSGNDMAALTAGYLSIVVGNASEHVIEHASKAHQRAGWVDRLYIASAVATSGVVEGCRHYGMIPSE